VKPEFLQKLHENLNEFEGLYGGACTLQEVQNAEQELRVNFCNHYKQFVLLYGGANLEGNFIYGLKKQRSMGKDFWSVIQNTKFYKDTQKWPGIEDWYVVSDDGRGNPIGIDPEGKVWLSDHDAGFEKVKLADNFEEFLHKLLTDTLYD